MDKVFFDSPVGSLAARAGPKLWPDPWFDATPFGTWYEIAPGRLNVHTGADLNAPGGQDVRAPIYAVAPGLVVFVGTGSGTWGRLVVVKHPLEDGSFVWARHAHLGLQLVQAGQSVLKGQVLGEVGDYGKPGPAQDHHHFDLARIDLGLKPSDWPGTDRKRVFEDYYDPLAFILARHAPLMSAEGARPAAVRVIAEPTLIVRQRPDRASPEVGRLKTGTVRRLLGVSEDNLFGKIDDGWILLAWTEPE